VGFTYVKVNLFNPARMELKREVELLVDTGAVLTAVPRIILEEFLHNFVQCLPPNRHDKP